MYLFACALPIQLHVLSMMKLTKIVNLKNNNNNLAIIAVAYQRKKISVKMYHRRMLPLLDQCCYPHRLHNNIVCSLLWCPTLVTRST